MNELKGHKILLVDDEPKVREAMGWLFESLGAQVTHAGSGDEALALFRPGWFSLVSTDYTMPGMDGMELVEAIRGQAREQKIIMISGYVDQLRGNRELLAMIGALLPKPCSQGDLAAALHKLGFPDQTPTGVAAG